MVWSKQQTFIERIYFDQDFLKTNIAKAKIFHSNIIMPEILGRWYSQSKDSVQVELWCECRQPDDGRELIRCANPDCLIQYFHLQCTKLSDVPNNTYWFYKACSIDIFKSVMSKC